MISVLAGVALLALVLYALKLWTNSDPRLLAAILTRAFAFVALAGAGTALLMGRFGAVVPLAVVGLMLLGRIHPGGVGGLLGQLLRGVFKAPGSRGPASSRVATPLLEMELDHATGALSGRFLSGAYAGRALDDVDVPSLLSLRTQCDAQSLSLLEAYLDRRAPAWREDAQGNAGRGNMGGGQPREAAMTEDEAYEVLGLEPGADAAAVRERHRALMKLVHPDLGGSSYLAARINQAKDLILRKHR